MKAKEGYTINMDKILVAHQPYFLPWLGYFNKLAYATHFLVLDDAQYRNRFYHSRALIRNSHGSTSWVTLPIKRAHRCAIKEAHISPIFNIDDIDNAIWDAYHKSDYYEIFWPAMREIILEHNPILAEVNLSLITHIMSVLGFVVPKIYFSSVGAPFRDSTDRLVYGCSISGAERIIMGEGGSLECHNLNAFRDRNVKIITQRYINNHPVYQQFGEGFVQGLSVLDALMCVGPNRTREMIALSSVFDTEWNQITNN